MTGYKLTESAENELQGILEFITTSDGPDRAEHVLERLLEDFENLTATPGMGYLRPQLTGPTLRWWPVFRYLVLYDPDSQPLMVMRIIHGSRSLGKVLEDL